MVGATPWPPPPWTQHRGPPPGWHTHPSVQAPAIDIWWWPLEICSNLFISGLTQPPPLQWHLMVATETERGTVSKWAVCILLECLLVNYANLCVYYYKNKWIQLNSSLMKWKCSKLIDFDVNFAMTCQNGIVHWNCAHQERVQSAQYLVWQSRPLWITILFSSSSFRKKFWLKNSVTRRLYKIFTSDLPEIT